MSLDDKKVPEGGPVVLEVTDVTPHNKALYEAGKTLLLESMETGREFCKFMIGASVGAIPVYIALLKFVLPEGHEFDPPEAYWFVTPGLIFIAAAVVFAIGYLPRVTTLSLDSPAQIESARSNMVGHRRRYARIGLVIYCLGLVSGGGITTMSIGFGKESGENSEEETHSARLFEAPRQELQRRDARAFGRARHLHLLR